MLDRARSCKSLLSMAALVACLAVLDSAAAHAERDVAHPTIAGPLVTVLGGQALLVADADPNWASSTFLPGASLVPGHKSVASARAAVDSTRLPASVQAHAGASQVRVYGPDGVVCIARLGRPVLHDEYHGPQRQVETTNKHSAETDASTIGRSGDWDTQNQDTAPWLVAALESVDGRDCSAGLWLWPATVATAQEPVIWRRSPNTAVAAAATKSLRERFIASRDFAELRSEYLGDEPTARDRAHWRQRWSSALRLEYWAAPNGEDGLVSLHFALDLPTGSASGEPGFMARTRLEHGWFAEIRGDEIRVVPTQIDPVAVFDADRDGELEILEQDQAGRWLLESSDELETSWSFMNPGELEGC